MRLQTPSSLGSPTRASAKRGKGLPDIAEVKAVAAADRWRCLIDLCGLPSNACDEDRERARIPCPICGGGDRANLSRDGKGALLCSHSDAGCDANTGDGIETVVKLLKLKDDAKSTAVGKAKRLIAEYYKIEPGQPRKEGPMPQPNTPQKSDKPEPEPVADEIANLRDQVYRALGETFGLSDAHREALRARGFDDEEIDGRGYWTAPEVTDALKTLKLQKAIIGLGDYKKIGEAVPGVCPGGSLTMRASYGNLMIPVRDVRGRIIALRMRRNEKDANDNRYLWLTSKDGPSPGSPCHLSRPMPGCELDSVTLRITEGELKADLATAKTHIKSLSIPGVGSWRKAIASVDEIEPKLEKILIAIDTDASENPAVAAAVVGLFDEFFNRPGLTVAIETWDATYKGIDDALAADDAKITELLALEALEYVKTLRPHTEAAAAGDGTQAEVDGEAASDRPKCQPVPVADFVAAHPEKRRPLIKDTLRAGETMNVIGASKAGKSWLILNLGIAMASGRHWLGRSVAKGRVLLIDNELHPEELASRVTKVMSALGVDRDDIGDRLDVLSLRGQLADINTLAQMVAKLKDRKYQLITLDAFYRTLPENTSENDNAQVTAIYNTIDHIAGSLDCAVVLNHHASKGDQSNKAITDIGSGAGSISRAADTHLTIRPHEVDGLAVLEGVCRSFKPVEPMSLRFDWPLWTVSDEPPRVRRPRGGTTPEKAASDQAEAKANVLAALTDGPLTVSPIRDATRMGQPRVMRAIEALIAEGKIISRAVRDEKSKIERTEYGLNS